MLYIPSFDFNLLCVHQLTQSCKCCSLFFPNQCFIQDLATCRMIGKGDICNDLYQLNLTRTPSSTLAAAASSLFASNSPIPTTYELWHYRLSHVSDSYLSLLSNTLSHFTSNKIFFCGICPFTKLHCLHFPSSLHKTTKPFEIVHCDLWGPSPQEGYTSI